MLCDRQPIRNLHPKTYLRAMCKAFDFCIPIAAKAVPSGPEWCHEIKYDGHRVRLEHDGNRVRQISHNGYDWTGRYPWIVESALKDRHKQFVIEGHGNVNTWAHLQRGAALRVRRPGAGGRGSAGAAFEHAEDQLGAAAGVPAGWHLRCSL